MKLKIKIVFLIALFSLSLSNAMAKSKGKFLKYNQVTDKEVLVESTKGIKILFTAYDNNSIGVSYLTKHDVAKLISPKNILSHFDLTGSIYVEELDELMQITTTSNDGLMIKVDKKTFAFNFIDKANNSEIVIDNELMAGLVSKTGPISLVVNLDGDHRLTANPKL